MGVKLTQPHRWLRELLIAEELRAYGPGGRWHIPGHRYEFLEALQAGEPVGVPSEQLLKALSHAGLPNADYGYGGRYWSSTFVLDERDQLTEVAR
jgi:hypothetical protein